MGQEAVSAGRFSPLGLFGIDSMPANGQRRLNVGRSGPDDLTDHVILDSRKSALSHPFIGRLAGLRDEQQPGPILDLDDNRHSHSLLLATKHIGEDQEAPNAN
jgi:hypothetical protein